MAIYVGVDLAWGDRARTGLAALDEQGSLVSLGDARTDDDIVSWLEPFVAGPCLLGIDAPLARPT
jgi:predicted RNase H-like nuclease